LTRAASVRKLLRMAKPKRRASATRRVPRARRPVLHAPWRIEYILGPRDKGCFLCDAARLRGGDETSWRDRLLLYRDVHVLVLLNRYPYISGHLLIAPCRHTADLTGLSEAESRALWELGRRAVKVLGDTLKPHGFNLGMNLGRAGGAGVEEHLHLHALPRWFGDTNFMPIVAGTTSLPAALEAVWDQVRPAFRSL
jgi:ATP adenylyltransferase